MSHRVSGGIAILAAVYLFLQGLSQLLGYDDFAATGNRHAWVIIALGIASMGVAVIVGIWGVLRRSNRAQSQLPRVVAPLKEMRAKINDGRRRLREAKDDPRGRPRPER